MGEYNVSNFQIIVILVPKDLDDLWQNAGEVGRDRSKIEDATVVVYPLFF